MKIISNKEMRKRFDEIRTCPDCKTVSLKIEYFKETDKVFSTCYKCGAIFEHLKCKEIK